MAYIIITWYEVCGSVLDRYCTIYLSILLVRSKLIDLIDQRVFSKVNGQCSVPTPDGLVFLFCFLRDSLLFIDRFWLRLHQIYCKFWHELTSVNQSICYGPTFTDLDSLEVDYTWPNLTPKPLRYACILINQRKCCCCQFWCMNV